LQAGGRRFDPVNLHQIQAFKAKRCSAVFGFDRLIIGCSIFNNLEEVK
jgi:hypothetical protein